MLFLLLKNLTQFYWSPSNLILQNRREPMLCQDEDALDWWRQRKTRYPHLICLVKDESLLIKSTFVSWKL